VKNCTFTTPLKCSTFNSSIVQDSVNSYCRTHQMNKRGRETYPHTETNEKKFTPRTTCDNKPRSVQDLFCSQRPHGNIPSVTQLQPHLTFNKSVQSRTVRPLGTISIDNNYNRKKKIPRRGVLPLLESNKTHGIQGSDFTVVMDRGSSQEDIALRKSPGFISTQLVAIIGPRGEPRTSGKTRTHPIRTRVATQLKRTD